MAKLLLVDDEAIVRDPLSLALTKQGHAVTTAAGGVEAVLALDAETFDILLLDITMPNMSGLDLLRHVRASTPLADLPVVMLTAANDKPQILLAQKLGISAYVLKSTFSIERLLSRIDAACAIPPIKDGQRLAEHVDDAPAPGIVCK